MAKKLKSRPTDAFEVVGCLMEALQEFDLSSNEIAILLERDGRIHAIRAVEALVNSLGTRAWETHDGVSVLREPLLTNGWTQNQWIIWYEKTSLACYDFSWPGVINLLRTGFEPMRAGVEIRPVIMSEFSLEECYPRTAVKIREAAKDRRFSEPPIELAFLLAKAIVEKKLALAHPSVIMHRSVCSGGLLKPDALLKIGMCHDTELKRSVKYIGAIPEKPGISDTFDDADEFVFMV